MNQLVQNYLERKSNESQEKSLKNKNELLIKLGLFEKEYSDKEGYSYEYPEKEWDNESKTYKYFKKVPVEVSDKEYSQILEYQKESTDASNNNSIPAFSTTNTIASVFKVLAWIIFFGGFIAGIVLGRVEVTRGFYYTYTDTEFSFAQAFTYWAISFINGMIFLGFAEIIQLLTDIKSKK